MELTNKPVTTQKQRKGQKITKTGRIYTPKKGWALRITSLLFIAVVIAIIVSVGLELKEPIIVLSIILPIHSFLILAIGWFFYKNPASGISDNALVSVIIPVFNQKSMIANVIEAINSSTHKNIEIIAINDGSTDGTIDILNKLSKKYSKLKIINKKNEGKRKAVAAGFFESKGKYIVLIDSDSIVDPYAITEFLKTFTADPEVGALVGHAKVLNAEKNLLTKFQDVWYDYFFNIRKTTESIFGCVLCCSGCMAAYRREAVADYIPYWLKIPMSGGDDRELTSYIIAPNSVKDDYAKIFAPKISKLGKKTMEIMSNYDDAEDRALTAQSLLSWKAKYVASSVVYTDVPEKWSIFLKQQKRWKKGTSRVNFFVSTFFWRKNPLMSIIFYIDFMSMFATPLIVFTIFVYVPLVLNEYLISGIFFLGLLVPGFAQGLDYKFRNPHAKNWKFKPAMDLVTMFVTSWLIFPAILEFRKNEWLTR